MSQNTKCGLESQKHKDALQKQEISPTFSLRLCYCSMRVCVCRECALPNLVPWGHPWVQRECMRCGHLGRASPSVCQICFLTPKTNQAGNHMAAQLDYIAGVRSSVKAPQYDAAWSHPSKQSHFPRLLGCTDFAPLIVLDRVRWGRKGGDKKNISHLWKHTSALSHKKTLPLWNIQLVQKASKNTSFSPDAALKSQLFVSFYSWANVHACVHDVCVHLSVYLWGCVSVSHPVSPWP